jgi:hypothetical protein
MTKHIKKEENMKKLVFLFSFVFFIVAPCAYGQEAVLATKLWEEFNTNEFAFENKYNGKKLILGDRLSVSVEI